MLLFLDISGGEILVILIVVFLIFGPNKLPEISRKIGKAMNDLKRASNDIRREIQQGAQEVTKDFKDVKNIIEPKNGHFNEEPVEKGEDHPDEKSVTSETDQL